MTDFAENAGAGAPTTTKDMETDIETTNWDECTKTFDSMELKEDLLRGIYAYGFEQPSAIQQRAVKPMLLKRDVIAQAQSGKKKILMCALVQMSALVSFFSLCYSHHFQKQVGSRSLRDEELVITPSFESDTFSCDDILTSDKLTDDGVSRLLFLSTPLCYSLSRFLRTKSNKL